MILALVLFEIGRSRALVPQTEIVYEGNPALPIALEQFSGRT